MRVGGLERAVVAGGHQGLDRAVLYVDVLEVPDAARWVRPGLFVLTTFYAVRDDVAGQIEVIRQLAAGGAAAVAVKVGRFVTRLDPRLLAAADEVGFPVLELPPGVPYVDVSKPLVEAILEDERVTGRRQSFLTEFLTGVLPLHGEGRVSEEYAQAMGIDLGHPNRVFAVPEGGSSAGRAPFANVVPAVKRVVARADRDGVVEWCGPGLVCLVRCPEPGALPGRRWLAELARALVRAVEWCSQEVTVGISGECGSYAALPEGYRQARRACVLGEAMDATRRVWLYEDVAWLDALVAHHTWPSPVSYLREYDLRHGTEYCRTLSAFLSSGGNVRETSRRLGLHRNTVMYRLEKVEQMLGMRLRAWSDRLALAVGLIATGSAFGRVAQDKATGGGFVQVAQGKAPGVRSPGG